MRPKDIKVGKTYCNRGKGTTIRKVINISMKDQPRAWFGAGARPVEPGVLYEQETSSDKCITDQLFLSSFAAWAGREV
jgi:hypothetical protein